MKTDNYFYGIASIEEGKKVYRDLLKEHHPDKGGDLEITKKINIDFEEFCEWMMQNAFENDERAEGKNPGPFADILKNVIRLNMRIEIIGHWIYAFDSYGVKEELKALGFWFSRTHKAWVYSGGKKRRMRGRYSTNQLRKKWGNEVVRETEDLRKVS